jgi:hypothetical protein
MSQSSTDVDYDSDESWSPSQEEQQSGTNDKSKPSYCENYIVNTEYLLTLFQ